MSRIEFRADVAEPRPAAAWAMVMLAGATLWITRQIDAWAVLAQAVALLLSLWRRADPFPWQRSPVALNLGMIGIVVGTIVVALRGHPSTIALAHFAATTQGLQLLDARPRRTEFLLVALALFQVVLAANLTDSVFFTPLLVAFLFATVWTLLLHTLRSEAVEAGVAAEVSRAVTPGLVRTTMIACTLSLVLAGILFVALPRLRSSVVAGPGRAPTMATAGFSDTVAFGELGRIRQDPRVVLRVETLEGEEPSANHAYWRGLAFDTFDGTSWSVTPSDRQLVPGSAEGGVGLGRRPDDVNLVQRIVREPVAAGVLFVVGDPRGIQGTVRRLERDPAGGLYAAGQADERVRYTVRSKLEAPPAALLQRDRVAPPRRAGTRYLQLPPLSEDFRALAERLVAGGATDFDRVRAIESHLLRNGRYSDTPPDPDPDSPLSPVERFALGDMAGHCEYFASAMVLLARSVGIPTRLVNGFAGGRVNSIGGFRELSRSDAHAWVEVHYEQAGWVRYDPTPADLRAPAQPALSLSARLRELGSAIELWWFQRVVGFDRSDQIGALRRAWLAWRASGGRREAARGGMPSRLRADGLEGPWREAVLVAVCLLGGAVVTMTLLRRTRGGYALPPFYARALRLLSRRGLVRAPAIPARDFAREVRSRCPQDAADAFDALTERYLALRFGGAGPRSAHVGASAEAAEELLRRLRAALARR